MRLKLLIFALFAFVSSAHGASFIKSYGIKAGAVAADQNWDFSNTVTGFPDKDGFRWGFDVGGFVQLFGAGRFGLLPEVHYIQKGMTYKIQETSYNYPAGTGQFLIFRPLLEYLSSSILVQINPVDFPVRPYFVAGPRVDILIGKSPEGFRTVYDKFNKLDFGGTFGVGVELQNRIMVELRYSLTFTQSYKGSFLGDPLKIKNTSLEILLGSRFH